MNRTKAATVGLLIPAGLALGMSADTSYRFLGERLGITNPWERGFLCGVAEAAIVALTIYAWATRTKGPAYLAYLAVMVQAVPAFEVSGGFGGTVRVALGPVLLTALLHLLLGLEVRMTGVRPDGLLRSVLRELRERLTASLGIGRRGEDSAAIARSRAADRAVNLADRVEAMKPGTKRQGRRAAKLAAAIDAARHGLDTEAADAAESAIVGRVVRRKSVRALATIEARHDWTAHLTERNTTVPAAVPIEEPGAAVTEAPEPLAELAPVPAVAPAFPAQSRTEADDTEAGRAGRNKPAPVVDASAGQTPVLTVIRNSGGTRADHIRALVSHGVTGTADIRNTLAAAGIPVPSDRYIRRLVSEARNTDVPATGTTGTHGYM
ncbi:MAG TPA: hypothetical protein VFG68_21500 [Fimbriiglobus sp.]|nr:hypothetical protein [Fimbriiglobus sp.]